MTCAQGNQEHQNPSKDPIRRSAPGVVPGECSSLGVRATGHAGSPMENQYP